MAGLRRRDLPLQARPVVPVTGHLATGRGDLFRIIIQLAVVPVILQGPDKVGEGRLDIAQGQLAYPRETDQGRVGIQETRAQKRRQPVHVGGRGRILDQGQGIARPDRLAVAYVKGLDPPRHPGDHPGRRTAVRQGHLRRDHVRITEQAGDRQQGYHHEKEGRDALPYDPPGHRAHDLLDLLTTGLYRFASIVHVPNSNWLRTSS